MYGNKKKQGCITSDVGNSYEPRPADKLKLTTVVAWFDSEGNDRVVKAKF